MQATDYEPTIQREILRISAMIAIAIGTAYALAGWIGRDEDLLLRSAGPLVLGGLALILLRKRVRADLFLMAAAGFVVVQVAAFTSPDVKDAASIGLVMIGAAASLFVSWRRSFFLASYTLLLSAALLWWYGSGGATISTVSHVAVPGMTFLFVSRLLTWSRRTVESREARYTHLFSRVPVSIWEEDFAAVERQLAHLRRSGVTDVRTYLTEHPEEIRALAAKIIVRDVNPATLDLLGVHDKEELLGPLRSEFFTGDTMGALLEQFVAIWEERDDLDIEVRGRTLTGRALDGRLRWVVPRNGGRSDLAHVVVAVVDTTELKRTERRLQDLVASKDQFIASVSHELRTPLTAVVGLAEELRQAQDIFSEVERREFLETIAVQAVDVSHIVEDLLVVARADSGTISVAAELIDLSQTIHGVVESMNGNAPVVHVPSQPLLIRADASRVRQILRNLLTNAVRYGGDHVEIRAGWADDSVWVEVADDGAGIPPEDRERIFEPYQSAHRAAGLTASVGLGLTVSRQLARLMGGDLEYSYSSGLSSFRLSLPTG